MLGQKTNPDGIENKNSAIKQNGYDVILEGITKRFQDVVAVDNVSLKVQKGEFLCILGPSGCGKTTTMRIIGGFEKPDDGKVYLAGQDVTYVPPDKRNTNLVFQNYALFPHMSVFDNVAFGLKIRGVPKSEISEKVERVLTLVKLSGFQNRKPHQLSGGQQQRIALARAVVNQPTVLLLDEPLGALDLKLRKQMQVELKNIQNQIGITFIYVTHDQEEALTMANRIAVMRDGKIEQIGDPVEIYENPSSAYVCDFIGIINMFKGTVIETTDNNSVIRLKSGNDIELLKREGLQNGKELVIGIRPEKLIISKTCRVNMPICITSSIVDINYQGTYTGYTVKVPAGETAYVMVQNQVGQNIFKVGEDVFLQWSEDATKIFLND